MITTTYDVVGLTCQHCVNAVTEELTALAGVSAVAVTLAAESISTVTVSADRPLNEEEVSAALDEAGDYRLVPV